MSTFQAILFSIFHGLAQFLPISVSAHDWLISYFLHWPEPTGPFLGAMTLGSLLALLVYFRHDWASIISSFLQVIIFRKKPMTLDERLPFFITLATIPIAGVWYIFQNELALILISPLFIVVNLVVFSLILWFAHTINRNTKSMFDWNWLDAVIIGMTQILVFLPGAGQQIGAFTGAFLRNYSRESAAKFIFYCLAPVITAKCFFSLRGLDFSAPYPMDDMTWLTFGTTIVVTFFISLLAIGGIMKNIQSNGMRGYIIYRFVLAVGILVIYYQQTL